MEYTVKTKVGVNASGRIIEVTVSDKNEKTITRYHDTQPGGVNRTIHYLVGLIFEEFLEVDREPK